jgi:hypothetical protein
MTKKTLEQLQEEHSEMCATAADLGMKVPADLTIDFDTVEVGTTVVSNLDALIRKFKAGIDEDEVDTSSAEIKNSLANEEQEKQGAAPKSPPKPKKASTGTTVKKTTPKAKQAEANNEATGEEPVAKKAVKKAAAPAKKGGPAKANGAKVAPAASKPKNGLDENAKITWTGKENPARKGQGRYDRIENVRKFSGKTVKTYLAAKGNPTTLKNCVKAKLCTVA